MSHFTVLVIGPDHEKQLQPFHEYECTGTEDEFVKDIDITDEARERYTKSTETRLKGPDGTLHSFFDAKGEWRPEFSQPDTDTFFPSLERRKQFVPDGFTEVEIPTSEVETFAQWVEGYYGHPPRVVDGVEKVIKRTNPNAKWDWWQVGGRWSGMLKLKPGATSGAVGQRGLMGSCAAEGKDRADHAIKGDIDFEGMRNEAGEKAGALWDKAHALTGGKSWESWESVRARIPDINAARGFYHGQAALKALKEGDRDAFGWDVDAALSGPRDAFVQAARDRAITTYAVLHKGEWCEKGRMGWFGMSTGDMEQSAWNRLFNDLIDSLPDDTPLTVVDCHI